MLSEIALVYGDTVPGQEPLEILFMPSGQLIYIPWPASIAQYHIADLVVVQQL